MFKKKIEESPPPVWYKRGEDYKYYENVIPTFMGRDALRILLNNLEKTKLVLLPAYICREVIIEFKAKGYKIFYYDINEDFSLDTDNIVKLLNSYKVDIFYYVVYFGMYSKIDTSFIRNIKENYNPYIIEDRAHYLDNTVDHNIIDAVIYSFRKLYPISEGGGLLVKNVVNYKYKMKQVVNILPIAMRIRKNIFGNNEQYSRSSLNIFEKSGNISVMPMSYFSKMVLDRIDVNDEINERKNIYNEWVEKLNEINIKPVFNTINKNDIPQGCPIYVKDSDYIQKNIFKSGIYLKRHWPLLNEVLPDAPKSYKLSNKVITLPIYKGLTDRDKTIIINTLKSYI